MQDETRRKALEFMELYAKVQAFQALGRGEFRLSREFAREARRYEAEQGKPEDPMFVLSMGVLDELLKQEDSKNDK